MIKYLLFLLLPLTLFGQSQKISDMTSATALTGSEYVPIVQTTNKKSTVTLLRGWASTIGTAGQLMKVNAGATALEFFTPSYLTALSNGNGTTASGSAVDLGGTQTGNIDIDPAVAGTYEFRVGYTRPVSRIVGYTDFEVDLRSENSGYTQGSSLLLQNSNSQIRSYGPGYDRSINFSNNGVVLDVGSDATGDTYYRNSSGYFTRLAAGTNGHVLTLAAGVPSWAAPSGGSGLTVGTSTITSGTNTKVLYNNSGVLGEYTVSGSGNVALTNSPVFTTPNIGTATGTASGNLLLAGGTYTTTTGNGLALTTSTLTSGSLVDLASTGTAAASSTQKVLNVATSGANGTSGQTTYGGYFSNTHTGTTSTNVGLYAVASGGTTDRAIWAVGDLVVQNPLTGSNSRGLSVIDNGGTERGFAKLVPSTDFRIGAGSGYPLYLYGGGTLSGALTTTGKWQVMDNPDNTSRAKLYVTHATGNTVPVLYTQSATRSSLTASTEVHENLFNQSITATFSTGALTTQRAFRITNPTYAFAGASTLTNAYSFYVDGAPVQGTNATITNSWAGGFGGPVKITGTSSGSALMLENSSGTEKVRYYDNGNYKNSQTNSTYFEKQMVGSTSATTYNEVLLTSSEISDGQSVRIEIMWTIKDTTANTSAGGTFVTTWSKASGTLVKAGDTELGTHDGVTGSWAVTSSDSSGSIQITWTGTAVNNSKISAFARILFNN